MATNLIVHNWGFMWVDFGLKKNKKSLVAEWTRTLLEKDIYDFASLSFKTLLKQRIWVSTIRRVKVQIGFWGIVICALIKTCVYVCVCVCACVRACVRARACVYKCYILLPIPLYHVTRSAIEARGSRPLAALGYSRQCRLA